MKCPVCGADTEIVNTRSVDVDCIRRRRECVECKYRFSTLEYEEETIKRMEASYEERKRAKARGNR